jgi:hypothetical protein
MNRDKAMNETTISRIQELFSALAEFFSKLSGIGLWFFMVGFFLLLLLAGIILLKALIAVLKIIPNLTVGQFIKLLLVVALVLMIAGLFIP